MQARRLLSASRRQLLAEWYLAGGAPVPVAVYQPLHAASLADSYLRIAGTGGNANLDPAVVGSGVAPTHSAVTGWGFNGMSQYLTTGIVPEANYTILVRFSNVSGTGNRGIVTARGSANANRFFIWSATSGNAISYGYGNNSTIYSSGITSGVAALAGNNGYFNGVEVATNIDSTTAPDLPLVIGAAWFNSGIVSYWPGNIQAVAIYPASTNHAVWVLAVSAAMTAL